MPLFSELKEGGNPAFFETLEQTFPDFKRRAAGMEKIKACLVDLSEDDCSLDTLRRILAPCLNQTILISHVLPVAYHQEKIQETVESIIRLKPDLVFIVLSTRHFTLATHFINSLSEGKGVQAPGVCAGTALRYANHRIHQYGFGQGGIDRHVPAGSFLPAECKLNHPAAVVESPGGHTSFSPGIYRKISG